MFDAASVGWRPPQTITQLFYPYSIRGDRYVSVEETWSIDAIGVDKQTGDVILTVSDHLEWSDNLKQQTLLQAKLNAYLRFVESGEILERYPNAKERRVVFCVVFKFAPDQEGSLRGCDKLSSRQASDSTTKSWLFLTGRSEGPE